MSRRLEPLYVISLFLLQPCKDALKPGWISLPLTFNGYSRLTSLSRLQYVTSFFLEIYFEDSLPPCHVLFQKFSPGIFRMDRTPPQFTLRPVRLFLLIAPPASLPQHDGLPLTVLLPVFASRVHDLIQSAPRIMAYPFFCLT